MGNGQLPWIAPRSGQMHQILRQAHSLRNWLTHQTGVPQGTVGRTALQHRLGELFDEQWHAIGSFDDFGDDVAVERDVTGQVLDKHRAVTSAQPAECQHCCVRLVGPWRMKLGPEGDDEHDCHPADPVDDDLEQSARRRVYPMRVFKDHQHRAPPNDRFELMDEGIEQRLALALRRQIELFGDVGQRQQFRDDGDLFRATRPGCE